MKNKSKAFAIAAFSIVAAVASAQQDIAVQVNGRPVTFPGTPPQMVDGRVLVPLRGVFERMGAYVQWVPDRQQIIATRGGTDVRLTLGRRWATINGRRLAMDVPPQEVDGSTLVPIRFVSEALGADVKWNDSAQLVMIESDTRAQQIGGSYNRPPFNDRPIDPPAPRTEQVIVERNTVIPVTLDETLSSDGSRRGDTFSATLRAEGNSPYGYLPYGARIEGHVISARPQWHDDPGLLELGFDRIRFPDGRSYAISGRLMDLNRQGIEKGPHGVLRAKGTSAQDDRTAYAGYGAGAGLVVGLLTKKPIEGTVLGGILGYLAGSQRQNDRPRNVRLSAGTEFGVRLTRDLAMNLPR